MNADPPGALTETLLGFDFGLRRIGVAVGSRLSGRAQPLASVDHHQTDPDWPAIEALVQEWQPARLIVGLPASLDGLETDMSTASRRFANAMHERFGLPVEMVDEQLSSSAALDELREARQSGRKKKRVKKSEVDPLAAKVILETWLNQPVATGLKDHS